MRTHWIGAVVGSAAILTLIGCGEKVPVQPTDASDANASMKWLAHALPAKSGAEAFDHARLLAETHPNDPATLEFLRAHSAALDAIPSRVMSQAIDANDFSRFEWAVSREPDTPPSVEELRKIWRRNSDWRSLAETTFPSARTVFMNEAVKDMNLHYFERHIASFNQNTPVFPAPLTAEEYQTHFIQLLGVELKKSMKNDDRSRMEFLLKNTPGLDQLPASSPAARANLDAFARYAAYELKDERLVAALLGLGYRFAELDLDQLPANSSLLKGLLKNPRQAVTTLGLDRADHPLTKAEIRLLLRMPIRELTNLHDEHILEATSMCLAVGATAQAIEFIELKAAKAPLTDADHALFMTWAMLRNDFKMKSYVKQIAGDIPPSALDLNAFAADQRVFEKHAPAFLENVAPVMDLTSPEGALTYGKIAEIMAHENQRAGLYLVRALKITDQEWKAVTGDRTLLMDASDAGNLLIVRHLVENLKTDVNATSRYSTAQTSVFGRASVQEGRMSALFFAARKGRTEVVEYLAKKGADVNAASLFGATPLMVAAGGGHLETVTALLKLGASPNARMDARYKEHVFEGRLDFDDLLTAATRAKAYSHEEVLAALRKAGATL